MRRLKFCALVLCGMMSARCALSASELDDTIKKLPAQNAQAREILNASLFKDTPATVGALSAMLVEPGAGDDRKARLALNTMAIYASRPGADPQRKQFAHTAAARLDGKISDSAKIFLLTQLRLTAGDDEVPAIAKLLGEAEISEPAAQTLLTINTPAARNAVRAALANVKGFQRAVVITALGNLRDKQAAAEILKDAESADPVVQNAALHALANIGDAAVAPALKKAVDAAGMDKWYERSQATQAQITLAQRLVEDGSKYVAANLSRELIQTRTDPKESYVQCAALNVLASALGLAAFNDIVNSLNSESVEVRAAARNLAVGLKGKDFVDKRFVVVPHADSATGLFAAEMQGGGTKLRLTLLEILRRRNDKSALTEIIEALKDTDTSVRTAAATALVIGDEDTLSFLLEILKKDSKGNEDEQAAARVSLAHLKGDGINAGIAAALKGAPVVLSKALIAALTDRAAVESLPVLVEAAKNADSSVRLAGLDSLGILGDTKTLPFLLETINKENDKDERLAAEKAAAAIASRHEHSATAIGVISDAFKIAPEKGKQALLRVLGKIGGAEALAALKPALKDNAAEVADTAVRELANWPDASALETQLEVAKETASLPHHVLTISGYVRLLGTQSKRPHSELVPLYLEALKICRRPDEKKKIVSGLQNLKSFEALKALEPLLEDAELKAEANGAYFNVAKEVAKSNKKAAGEAFKKIIDGSASEQRKKDAQAELDKIK